MNYKDYVDAAEQLNKYHQEAEKLIGRYPATYFFEKMRGYAIALFDKYAPFRPGDRVMLTKTPEITAEKSWGWMGAKHFLVRGALATVYQMDYIDGRFIAGCQFDDDSWISDHDKQLHAIVEKGIYTFGEDYLKVVGSLEKAPDECSSKQCRPETPEKTSCCRSHS